MDAVRHARVLILGAGPAGVPMERLRRYAGCADAAIVSGRFHTAHLREQPIRLVGDRGTCTCDALVIAPGPDVLVVGAGATALEAALDLSHIAGKVTLMHRRDRLRADPVQVDRLMAKVAQGRSALALNQAAGAVPAPRPAARPA